MPGLLSADKASGSPMRDTSLHAIVTSNTLCRLCKNRSACFGETLAGTANELLRSSTTRCKVKGGIGRLSILNLTLSARRTCSGKAADILLVNALNWSKSCPLMLGQARLGEHLALAMSSRMALEPTWAV